MLFSPYPLQTKERIGTGSLDATELDFSVIEVSLCTYV